MKPINNNHELGSFEKHLHQLVKKQEKIPFSTEEVLQILKSYNPPEDIEKLQDESIINLMKEEYEKRTNYEQKLKNLSLIHSLGELIKIFCNLKNISPKKLAQVIGLSPEEFEDYEKDNIPPESFAIEPLMNLMIIIGIPVKEMINILDKTMKLFRIKQDTNIAASYARTIKELQDSQKMRVRDSAMKELLIGLDEGEKSDTDEWEKFKNDLVNVYEKEKSEFDDMKQCYTIKTQQRKYKIDKILQQI